MSNPSFTGIESSLSPYAGPYVSEMLGKARRLLPCLMKPTADLLLRGNRASKTRRFKGWQDLVSRLVWAGLTLCRLRVQDTPHLPHNKLRTVKWGLTHLLLVT